MRKIDRLVVHCSATPPEMDIGAAWIRDLHVDDNGWIDIGYHYVVRRDGTIEDGRPVKTQGAHVRGANAHSIGVCWVGGIDKNRNPDASTITDAQWDSLVDLLIELSATYGVPVSRIQGHNEVIEEVGGSPKACPAIDMDEFRKELRAAKPATKPMRIGEDMVEGKSEKVSRATAQAIVDLAKTLGPVVGGAAATLAKMPTPLGVAIVAGGVVCFGIWRVTRER